MYPGQDTAVAHSAISPEVLTFWCVLFKSYFLRILFTSRSLLCCFLHLPLWPKQFPMLLKAHFTDYTHNAFISSMKSSNRFHRYRLWQ